MFFTPVIPRAAQRQTVCCQQKSGMLDTTLHRHSLDLGCLRAPCCVHLDIPAGSFRAHLGPSVPAWWDCICPVLNREQLETDDCWGYLLVAWTFCLLTWSLTKQPSSSSGGWFVLSLCIVCCLWKLVFYNSATECPAASVAWLCNRAEISLPWSQWDWGRQEQPESLVPSVRETDRPGCGSLPWAVLAKHLLMFIDMLRRSPLSFPAHHLLTLGEPALPCCYLSAESIPAGDPALTVTLAHILLLHYFWTWIFILSVWTVLHPLEKHLFIFSLLSADILAVDSRVLNQSSLVRKQRGCCCQLILDK